MDLRRHHRGGGAAMTLYGAAYGIWRVLRNMGLLARNAPGRRGLALGRTYLKLLAVYLVAVRLFRRPLTSARMLGYTVRFFDYATFLFLFEELFIEAPYRFDAVRPDPFIVDAGSNIGMSVLYFKWLYPDAVIVGFEPDKPTFEMLERNIAANRLRGVRVSNRAVLDRPGAFELHYQSHAPGFLGMAAAARPGLDARITAEAVVLSSILDRDVDFLKLDIEGAETPVLQEAARQGVLRRVRELVLEYHHHMHGDDDRLSELLALFEQQGFGYDLAALVPPPFQRRREQGMLIYAYRKEASA
jgi:FkbM family methyltransferase